ncbi:MAG: glutaredoxin family protein [Thermomicrobiales bacterium]|nr:hypothetical protein [Thermomicrobiales bacterium]
MKALLSAWEIPFVEKDITHDPAAVEELVRFGAAAPLTVIDGVPVSDLNAAALEALLSDE